MAKSTEKKLQGERPENPYANKPKLEKSDFGGKEFAIGTIANVEWVNMTPADEMDDGGEGDWKLVLTYKEYPGKQHVVNKTGYRNLVTHLPPAKRDQEWVGLRIPLMVKQTTDPRDGSDIERVWVAINTKWDAIMAKDKPATSRK